jgi:hypothetical protein
MQLAKRVRWRELHLKRDYFALQQPAVAIDEITGKKQEDALRGLTTPRRTGVDRLADEAVRRTAARERSQAPFGKNRRLTRVRNSRWRRREYH